MANLIHPDHLPKVLQEPLNIHPVAPRGRLTPLILLILLIPPILLILRALRKPL